MGELRCVRISGGLLVPYKGGSETTSDVLAENLVRKHCRHAALRRNSMSL